MDFDIVGLITALQGVFENFKAGIFVGVSYALYLVIQLLRGKGGFSIPFITDKFNSIKSAAVKTWIIVGLFVVVGGVTAVANGGLSFTSVYSGLLAGLTLGLTTLGCRTVSKTTMESEEFKKVTDTIKQALVKKDK